MNSELSALTLSREERLKKALVKSHLAHQKKISSLSWSCSGHLLASGSVDQTIRLWSFDHTSGELKKPSDVLREHKGTVDALAWHPRDPNLLASGSSDKSVIIWNTKESTYSYTKVEIKGQPLSMAWSVDGTFLFVGTREDSLYMIEGRRGAIVMQHDFKMELNEFALTPSGLIYCATGNRGAAVDEGMVTICRLVHATSSQTSQHLSSSGSSNNNNNNGSNEGLLRWALEEVVRVKAHSSPIISLKFSPTFRVFATGASDSIVTLWDATEVTCLRTIDKSDSQVRGLSFSYSGEYLALACGDKDESPKALDIYRVLDGSRVRSIPVKDGCSVNHVAWAPQTQLVAFALDEPPNTIPKPLQPGNPATEAGALRLLVAV